MLRPLVLTKKTGFLNKTPNVPVNIRDFRGILFYSTESILPVYKFNLPPGRYLVDSGNFVPLKKPVRYKLAKLPWIPQRFYKKPWDFKLTFARNPSKCSIIWGKRIIIFDNALREKPLNILFFIFFHEIGHAEYRDEHLADLRSQNYMKQFGFNPSQIVTAPYYSLSSGADYRKLIMINSIRKTR
jgi:hypothetical protein